MNVVFRPSIRSKQQRLHVLFTGRRGLGVPLNLFLGVAKKGQNVSFLRHILKKKHTLYPGITRWTNNTNEQSGDTVYYF